MQELAGRHRRDVVGRCNHETGEVVQVGTEPLAVQVELAERRDQADRERHAARCAPEDAGRGPAELGEVGPLAGPPLQRLVGDHLAGQVSKGDCRDPPPDVHADRHEPVGVHLDRHARAPHAAQAGAVGPLAEDPDLDQLADGAADRRHAQRGA